MGIRKRFSIAKDLLFIITVLLLAVILLFIHFKTSVKIQKSFLGAIKEFVERDKEQINQANKGELPGGLFSRISRKVYLN